MLTEPPPLPRKPTSRPLVTGCLSAGAILVAGVLLLFVFAVGRCAWSDAFGSDDWATSIRYTLHIDPPQFSGGHVSTGGLREEVRTIWVYGEPAEIRKLVDSKTMRPDSAVTIEMAGAFPSAVLGRMKKEDFVGVIPWRRDWPDSEPKGHTMTWVWIHPNETSAVICFYSSTN